MLKQTYNGMQIDDIKPDIADMQERLYSIPEMASTLGLENSQVKEIMEVMESEDGTW